jgi:small GTP-binding protein
MAHPKPYRLNRISLCGDARVGKTALFNLIQGRPFSDAYEPTSVAAYAPYRNPDFNNRHVSELSIWDTAGEQSLRASVAIFLRKLDVAVIVTDNLQKRNQPKVQNWVLEIERASEGFSLPDIVLVRTQVEQRIKREEEMAIEAMRRTFHCDVFLLSAKTGEGVNDLLRALFRICEERILRPPAVASGPAGPGCVACRI